MFKAKNITDMTIDEMTAHTLEVITFMSNYANEANDTVLIEQAFIDAGYCIEKLWEEYGNLRREIDMGKTLKAVKGAKEQWESESQQMTEA